jgi:hypothetical protein
MVNFPVGVEPSPIFSTYWNYLSKRQAIFWKRQQGLPGPWTDDPILQKHKFTQAYRVLDRVSQYLVKNVIEDYKFIEPDITLCSGRNTFFRILLFKIFNKPETWELLTKELGEEPEADNFTFDRYDAILTKALEAGEKISSNAYMMTAAGSWGERRHRMYLRLLQQWLDEKVPERISSAKSLAEVFSIIRGYRTMGDFLALQYTIDLNYSPMIDFSEMDFVLPGPGAKRGIMKCFKSIGNLTEAEIIRWMAETQDEHFLERGLEFKKIGDRPLQLIDIQSGFCEVDKYSREAHPEVSAKGDDWAVPSRARIKQRFNENPKPIEYVFPHKWNISL